jgi:hypothetical protein
MKGSDVDRVRFRIRHDAAIPNIPKRFHPNAKAPMDNGNLSRAQSHRALLQQAEAVSTRRHRYNKL